jgi:hypothetical protein
VMVGKATEVTVVVRTVVRVSLRIRLIMSQKRGFRIRCEWQPATSWRRIVKT